jgi:hypothetical protein
MPTVKYLQDYVGRLYESSRPMTQYYEDLKKYTFLLQ